jgi:mRNA interferase RelE/StbE
MSDPQGSWRVVIDRSVERSMRKLPHELRTRIAQAIMVLATNPRPHGCLKLAGYTNLWRIRVGGWRVIYAIEDEEMIVLVVQVSPRASAYHGLP